MQKPLAPQQLILNLLESSPLNRLLEISYFFEKDTLKATFFLNSFSKQPFGSLHGGISAFLAESLGSASSLMHIDSTKEKPVGINLHIQHLTSTSEGQIEAKALPIKLGKSLHTWEILIEQQGDLLAKALLTVKILS